MTQPLLPNKRLWKNRKGYSSIIGAIFLIIIVLFLCSNVFLFILNQNTSFQEGVSEVNEMDTTQGNEKIAVSNTSYTVMGDQVYVNAQVTNEGPVSVQIITLRVVDTTTRKDGYNDTVNINLKSGNTLNFTGSDALIVTIEGANEEDVFVSWFVTARGNLISLEEGQGEIIVAQVALGIGALALDLDNFRYFTYESSQKLANYPDGTIGFDVPAGTYIAFGCYLTNFDQKKRTITIDAHSLFWQPSRSGVGEGAWFIANVDSNGTITSTSQGTYTPVTVNYGEKKMLVFTSKFDLDLGNFDRLKTDNAVTTVATFLCLHGSIGSVSFAQNIPYVSLFYC